MRHGRAPFTILHRSNSLSFHHQSNFSTIQRQVNQTSEHKIFTHLLKICLQQCQRIKIRHPFDETPQRLAQASRTSKTIHAQSLKFGFGSKGRLGSAIVDLYAKCGNVEFAAKAFNQLEKRDILAWNSVLSMYSRQGSLEQVIWCFGSLQNCGVSPNQFTYAIVLSSCARLVDIDLGKQVHCGVIKMGFEFNSFCEGSLIDMYSKCSSLVDARKIFDAVVDPDTVSWTAMIAGYVQVGLPEEALNVFEDMQQLGLVPDQVAFVTVITACVGLGRLDDACDLFVQMPNTNVVAWNVMISGHVKRGCDMEAIDFFKNMWKTGVKSTRSTLGSVLSAIASLEALNYGLLVHALAIKQGLNSNVYVGSSLINMYAKCEKMEAAKKVLMLWMREILMILDGIAPDEVSLASILSGCANLQALEQGEQVHCFLVKSGLQTSLYAGSSLIDMYVKCGAIEAARYVFSCMPSRSVVSMNAIIAGYAQNDLVEAIDLFQEMQNEGLNPSEITFASLLDACNGPYKLNLGRQIHCLIQKRGLLYDGDFLGVSLLVMYMNSQRKTDADILFSEFQYPKSTILWTAIISGHTQNGCSEEALQLYQEMHRNNARPDQATFASVLRACSILASLGDGRVIHSLIFHVGLDSDELTGSALVDMYAKCGDMKSSVQVLKKWLDLLKWVCRKCTKIFDEMKQTRIRPDDVTFLGVLTACSHAGRVSEGREIFDIMVHSYKIAPRLDHCACMIDLLGRWGFLKEAEEFIDKLNFEPDAMIWATLLGACRIHGDDIRGRRAAEKLIELEPENSSPYVLLSNIYAASGNWDEVNSVRRAMREKGLRNAGEIHALLQDLIALMKEDGYVAETDSLLEDED
ncbi:hypothetical protein AAG906_025691 [Vitis piasezkii]